MDRSDILTVDGLIGHIPAIGVLGSGTHVNSLTLRLREKASDSDIEQFSSAEELFQQATQRDFDFIILASETFTAENALLLRQLKLLDADPRVLVVTNQKNEPEEILHWLQAGADRVLLQHNRSAEEALQQIAALERDRKAHDADNLSRARSGELVRRLSEKAQRFEEFGMTVAHDIRGPLGNIQMQLEYALDSFSGEMPSRCKNVLEKVIGNAERLQTMVQGMYQYAKFGAQAAKKSEVAATELIRTVISDLNIDERLDVTIELGSLPKIWGNPELLRRVFLNILNNAIKYGDKQEIRVKISGESFSDRSLGQTAKIIIEDNGPGIPLEKRAKLLSMFQRGEGQTTDGLGVGLAVVSRICEVHFGQVYIEDSELGGAKFTVELPGESIIP